MLIRSLVAVCQPIISGVLQSLSNEVAKSAGGRDAIPLHLLGRLRKAGDGDCGVAFEYAIREAVLRREPIVSDRVADALRQCSIRGDPASILFAIEKGGAKQLISTELGLITENSRVLSGKRAASQ